MLVKNSTKITAIPIPKALLTVEVGLPKKGHIPNKETKIAFSLNKGLIKIEDFLFFIILHLQDLLILDNEL